jgi:hypothetical protein
MRVIYGNGGVPTLVVNMSKIGAIDEWFAELERTWDARAAAEAVPLVLSLHTPDAHREACRRHVTHVTLNDSVALARIFGSDDAAHKAMTVLQGTLPTPPLPPLLDGGVVTCGAITCGNVASSSAGNITCNACGLWFCSQPCYLLHFC